MGWTMPSERKVTWIAWVAVVVALLAVTPTGAGEAVAAMPDGPVGIRNPVQLPTDLAANPGRPDDPFVEGEILVAFQPGLAAARIDTARRDMGAITVRSFAGIGVHQWRLPQGLSVEAALRALSGNPYVRYAEPNYLWYANAIPDDARRNDLWGMHNLGQTGGALDADIDALEAWDVRADATPVVVGVIDTGVDYNHEDLAGNIWVNPGEDRPPLGTVDGADFNGADDDGNGKVDDLRGWDCVNDDNDPIDDNNHGTHVSGTIGGRGNNGVGVVGVSWTVRIMPLKFLGAGGSGSTTDAIECVNYAASFVDGSGNKIVRVTSNSWGGGRRSNALQDAIAASGALFVAAAGNSGSSAKMYPAAYEVDNILAVAATDHNDALASFSNFGTWVDLAAPGVSILSSTRNDGYGSNSGTSMATPHVSGAAALVMAEFPAKTILEVKTQLMSTVDVLPSLQGKVVSNGRLNVARAVGGTPDPSDPSAPSAVTDLAAGGATATTVPLTWTATGDDAASGTAYLYDMRYLAGEPVSDANWDTALRASGEPIPKAAGAAESFTVTRLQPSTTYHFGLKILDEVGNPSGLSNAVSATTAASAYTIQTVETVAGSSASYKSLAYDSSGNPGIAFTATNGVVRFARWNGATWLTEAVGSDTGAGGVSVAFRADGAPAISYSTGKLKYAVKAGASWTIETVEKANIHRDVTSLAFDASGNPAIAYRSLQGSGGLKLARHVGLTWVKEVVDAGAAARYNSLAFDSLGNPAIAYSDDDDADGWLDDLYLARQTGTAWAMQLVETGVVGYGVFVSLAFNPVTGHPAIAHGNFVPSRYAWWDGAAWTVELVAAGRYGELGFDDAGAAYIGASASGLIKVARRDPGTGVWAEETVYEDGEGWIFPMKLDSLGRPSVVFAIWDGTGDTVTFARRNAPWT